jgi:hypothetical protein
VAYERVWALTYDAAFEYWRKRGHPEADDLGAEAAVRAVEAFFEGLPRNLDRPPGFFHVVLHNQCCQARRDWARGPGRVVKSGDGAIADRSGQTRPSSDSVSSEGADAMAETRQRLKAGLFRVCEHVLRLEDVARQLRGNAHLKRRMLRGAATFYRDRLDSTGAALGGFRTAEEARARIGAIEPVRVWNAVGLPEEPGELYVHISAGAPISRNSFDQRAKELRRQHGIALSAFQSQDDAT